MMNMQLVFLTILLSLFQHSHGKIPEADSPFVTSESRQPFNLVDEKGNNIADDVPTLTANEAKALRKSNVEISERFGFGCCCTGFVGTGCIAFRRSCCAHVLKFKKRKCCCDKNAGLGINCRVHRRSCCFGFAEQDDKIVDLTPQEGVAIDDEIQVPALAAQVPAISKSDESAIRVAESLFRRRRGFGCCCTGFAGTGCIYFNIACCSHVRKFKQRKCCCDKNAGLGLNCRVHKRSCCFSSAIADDDAHLTLNDGKDKVLDDITAAEAEQLINAGIITPSDAIDLLQGEAQEQPRAIFDESSNRI